MFYKEITKKETRKYRTSRHLTALSNTTVKQFEWGDEPQKNNTLYIFKAKEGKQYQGNGTENLFVVIMYLIIRLSNDWKNV